jgi:hypothetical protein
MTAETERGLFTLKATTTVGVERGTFTAVISTGNVDRQKDIVDPDAMVKALQKWVQVGKKIPLDWNHGEGATDQIGHVDPASVKNVDGEVVVVGWIDQSTENGEHAWRLVKSGTLGFSFYGLIPRDSMVKRKGGGLHIRGDFDVAAVTATPTPVNNETRVLAWKALEQTDSGSAAAVVAVDGEVVVEPASVVVEEPPATEAELAKQEQEQRLGEATKDVPKGTPPAPDPVEELTKRVDELATQFEAFEDSFDEQLEGIKAAVEEPKRANTAGHDPLRKRSDQAALEIQSGGISLRKSPTQKPQEPVVQAAPEAELKKRFERQMLELLTGDVSHDTQ